MARIAGAVPARVIGLRRRIEHWRRHRDSRAIPEGLWSAAASLARQHGVSLVSRVLRLDYSALKRRAGRGGKDGVKRRRRSARFIDLGSGPWLGRPATESPAVELWGTDGSRLVIRFSGKLGPEVCDLATSLWKHR